MAQLLIIKFLLGAFAAGCTAMYLKKKDKSIVVFNVPSPAEAGGKTRHQQVFERYGNGLPKTDFLGGAIHQDGSIGANSGTLNGLLCNGRRTCDHPDIQAMIQNLTSTCPRVLNWEGKNDLPHEW